MSNRNGNLAEVLGIIIEGGIENIERKYEQLYQSVIPRHQAFITELASQETFGKLGEKKRRNYERKLRATKSIDIRGSFLRSNDIIKNEVYDFLIFSTKGMNPEDRKEFIEDVLIRANARKIDVVCDCLNNDPDAENIKTYIANPQNSNYHSRYMNNSFRIGNLKVDFFSRSKPIDLDSDPHLAIIAPEKEYKISINNGTIVLNIPSLHSISSKKIALNQTPSGWCYMQILLTENGVEYESRFEPVLTLSKRELYRNYQLDKKQER